MSEPLRSSPPWQIVVPSLALGASALFVTAIIIGGLAGGDYAPVALLTSTAIVIALTAIVIGLFRRWRATRFLGFLCGVALLIFGIYIYGRGSSGIEPVVGLVIAIPLASRSAQRWMAPRSSGKCGLPPSPPA